MFIVHFVKFLLFSKHHCIFLSLTLLEGRDRVVGTALVQMGHVVGFCVLRLVILY